MRNGVRYHSAKRIFLRSPATPNISRSWCRFKSRYSRLLFGGSRFVMDGREMRGFHRPISRSLKRSLFQLAFLVVIALMNATANAVAGQTLSCPYPQARYTLRKNDDVIAGFSTHPKIASIPGNLFFYVTVKSRHWTYWYFPETGAGYTDIMLIPVGGDPATQDWSKWKPPAPLAGERLTFFGLNQDLAFRTDYPSANLKAPYWIFIPELGPHIWYDPRESGANRYYVPRAFLQLDHCDRD